MMPWWCCRFMIFLSFADPRFFFRSHDDAHGLQWVSQSWPPAIWNRKSPVRRFDVLEVISGGWLMDASASRHKFCRDDEFSTMRHPCCGVSFVLSALENSIPLGCAGTFIVVYAIVHINIMVSLRFNSSFWLLLGLAFMLCLYVLSRLSDQTTKMFSFVGRAHGIGSNWCINTSNCADGGMTWSSIVICPSFPVSMSRDYPINKYNVSTL